MKLLDNKRARTWLIVAASITLCCIQVGANLYLKFNRCEREAPATQLRITLVTTLRWYEVNPKPCSEGFLQNLAIESWLEFADEVVLLVDDDKGCPAVRNTSSKVVCVGHHCVNQQYKKPAMPCLFASGEALASSDIIMYTNPDFVYGNVRETVDAIRQFTNQFVVVGRRISIDAEELCTQQGVGKHHDLMRLGMELGQVNPDHAGWAMDYFIFTKYSLPIASMPPFVVGVWRWDNWLLGEAVRYGTATVIDATDTIAATHLGSTPTALNERVGAKYNNDLWFAALPGNKPIPKPAGLGDMQFASFYTVRRSGIVRLVRNETAELIVSGHVKEILEAVLLTSPPPPALASPPPLTPQPLESPPLTPDAS